ncbi:hypothetical protein C8J57DRAFT_1121642 [Mycena rebaudengoi]|nr:hypothetical protein C8J57DRAFT_1121642 [Mycena rebaudengoi]
MSRGRSVSPRPIQDVDMEVDKNPSDKSSAKVVVITNLTRNVVEAHLKTIFAFYGDIVQIDLPVFAKSGQNRGKAAVEFVDPPSAQKAASHMDGGQIDGSIIKVELSTLPVRSRSRSRPRPPRNGHARPRSFSRSRSRSRSPPGPGFRRRGVEPPRMRDTYRGRPFRRGGPPGRDFYRRGRSRSRSRSRSPVRRGPGPGPGPRRRSPSYQRGGYGRRRSTSRRSSVRSSRSRSRSMSRSRSRSSYSSYSRYSRSRSRSRSGSRVKRSLSREDIRDSRSRSRSPKGKD